MVRYVMEWLLYFLDTLSGRKPLYFKHTPKKTIKVGRSKEGIYLTFGATLCQSVLRTDGSVGLEVWHNFLLAPYFLPPTQHTARVCILGFGGGASALYFKRFYPQFKLTGVEIDPDVIMVARQFFQVPESVNIIQDDALHYIVQTTQTFDIVICDLFNKNQTIDQVASEAFLETIVQRLSETGVLVINFVGKESAKQVILDFLKSQNLSVFLLRFKLSGITNNVIFATKQIIAEDAIIKRFAIENRDALKPLTEHARNAIKQV